MVSWETTAVPSLGWLPNFTLSASPLEFVSFASTSTTISRPSGTRTESPSACVTEEPEGGGLGGTAGGTVAVGDVVVEGGDEGVAAADTGAPGKTYGRP